MDELLRTVRFDVHCWHLVSSEWWRLLIFSGHAWSVVLTAFWPLRPHAVNCCSIARRVTLLSLHYATATNSFITRTIFMTACVVQSRNQSSYSALYQREIVPAGLGRLSILRHSHLTAWAVGQIAANCRSCVQLHGYSLRHICRLLLLQRPSLNLNVNCRMLICRLF